MDIQTAFYHARIQHIRNVLTALGPIRVTKAMTAFEDGASTWGECFFARAFQGELNLQRGDPEKQIMQAIGIKTRVPVRFVWTAFDSARSSGLTRAELENLIKDIMTQEHTAAAEKFLRSIEFDESKPVELVCV